MFHLLAYVRKATIFGSFWQVNIIIKFLSYYFYAIRCAFPYRCLCTCYFDYSVSIGMCGSVQICCTFMVEV